MAEHVGIDPERIGLPATATVQDIQKAVYAQPAEKAALVAEVAKWKERAEENQARLIEANKQLAATADASAEYAVQNEMTKRGIDQKHKDTLVALYKKDDELCLKFIAEMEDKTYLERQNSMHLVKTEVLDPLKELDVRVAELMKADPKLSKGEAMKRVQDTDPDFAERYRNRAAGGER